MPSNQTTITISVELANEIWDVLSMHIFTEDGEFNNDDVFAAREKLWEVMKANGLT